MHDKLSIKKMGQSSHAEAPEESMLGRKVGALKALDMKVRGPVFALLASFKMNALLIVLVRGLSSTVASHRVTPFLPICLLISHPNWRLFLEAFQVGSPFQSLSTTTHILAGDSRECEAHVFD